MLVDLPVEILAEIANKLVRKRDLKHFCESSRHLYDVVAPILYKQFIITAPNENVLDPLEVSPLSWTYNPVRNPLQNTKHFEVRAKSGAPSDSCCVRRCQVRNGEGLRGPCRLAADLVPLLKACPENGLRSFTWDLGLEIPQEILGCSGYLPLKQRSIESIHLVTDPLRETLQINLPVFENLKKLTWISLKSHQDAYTLRRTLRKVSFQLLVLELDIVPCSSSFFHHPVDQTCLKTNILRFPELMNPMFPSLQVLSLSNVIFLPQMGETARAFDFGSLKSLTLRFCHGWEDFLQSGIRSNKPIRLKFFELQCSESGQINPDDSIAQFLQSFQGLEQLAIYTFAPSHTPDIWRAARYHKASLKIFVHHQRVPIRLPLPILHLQEPDHLTLSLYRKDYEGLLDWDSGTSENPLVELNLEFLGLCTLPTILESVLSFLAGNRTLRVLHIRRTVSYFKDDSDPPKIPEADHRLAQWAFGPQGLPSLEAIFHGDFSPRWRDQRNQLVLCRNTDVENPPQQGREEKTYRRLLRDDPLKGELVERHSSGLAACPTPDSLDGRFRDRDSSRLQCV